MKQLIYTQDVCNLILAGLLNEALCAMGKQWERFQHHSDVPGFQGSPKASRIPIAIFPLDACSSRKLLVVFSLEGGIAFVLETRTGSYCSFELKIDLKIVALPKEQIIVM